MAEGQVVIRRKFEIKESNLEGVILTIGGTGKHIIGFCDINGNCGERYDSINIKLKNPVYMHINPHIFVKGQTINLTLKSERPVKRPFLSDTEVLYFFIEENRKKLVKVSYSPEVQLKNFVGKNYKVFLFSNKEASSLYCAEISMDLTREEYKQINSLDNHIFRMNLRLR